MFPFHTNLEQHLISLLQKGPLSTADLLSSVRKKRSGTTKQGMYAALRKLVKAEIVVKHKTQVSLNVTWLTKLDSFTSLASHFYSSNARSGSFLDLADGDRISYEFKSANSTDAFWIHLLLLLETYPEAAFFAYNPHCWFFLVRPESERTLRDVIVRNKSQYLVTVGGKRPLDRAIKREFDGKRSQYAMRESPLFKKNNYYVNVIGDYVIEVWIDAAHAEAIERLYRSAESFTPDVEDELRDIINAKGKTKLVVSRDKKKAEKLRRMLAKPFYVRRAR